MKKRIIALLAAVTLILAFALTSCATFKAPEDTSAEENDETTVPSDTDTKARANAMNLTDVDLTEYVKLGDYDSLKVEVTVNVSDEKLEEEMKEYAEYNAIFDTEAITAAGDTLVINFIGRINDVAFDGGTANNSTIVLADETGFIPGFDKDLYGIKVGTTVFTTVTFPEDYENSVELRGKEAIFEITVVGIDGKYALTDESVTKFTEGDYTTVEDFRKFFREQMIIGNLDSYESDLEEAIILALKNVSEIKELPKEQVDYYFNDMYDYYEAMYTANASAYMYYGIYDFESFKTACGITDDTVMDTAELCTVEDILLVSVAKAIGKGTVTSEEFAEKLKEYVEKWGYESSAALIESSGENYLRNTIVKERAMDYLKEKCEITSDYDEFKYLLEETAEETSGETSAD